MRKLGLALCLLLGSAPAQAQNAGWPPPPGAQAMLCVYNLVQPTVTSGQAAFVNCDQHGNLVTGGGGSSGGTATAADPTYTEGQTSAPLSLDLSGHLRVLDAAVLAAVNSPVPTTAPSDCSGTVTSGGTAQSIIGAGTAPHGFQIQNLSTDALGFSWTTVTPAVGTNGTYTLNAGSSSTSAGGSYNSPLGIGISAAVFLIGATTGDKFTCSKW